MMLESINMVRQDSYQLPKHEKEFMFESGVPALKRFMSFTSFALELPETKARDEEQVIFIINTCAPVEE